VERLKTAAHWLRHRIRGPARGRRDFFEVITLPIRRLHTCATLVVSGWGRGLVAISSIDVLNANKNFIRGEHRFINGQWYRFRLEVRENDLKGWLDEPLIINASVRSRTISLLKRVDHTFVDTGKYFTNDPYADIAMMVPHAVNWQEMTIAPERLINRFNQKPMSNWSSVGKIHFLPKQGSDLTKVIFADFKWVP